MKTILYILLIFLLFPNEIIPQKTLTLEQAIDVALDESYQIKSAQYDLQVSKNSMKSEKLSLLPSIDIEFDLPKYSESLSSQFNTTIGKEEFYEVGNTKIESRLNISQPIYFTNGNFKISGSLFARDQFGSNRDVTRDYYSNIILYLTQPLFTFNSQTAQLEREKVNLKKAERSYSLAERDLIYDVKTSFYSLLKTKENVKILEEKVRQITEAYQTAQNKFNAGLIAEVEMLQLEVDLSSSKNDLLGAERQLSESENDFKLLIGLPLNEDIDIIAELKYEPIEIEEKVLLESALKNRSDKLNSEDDIYLSELNIDEVSSKYSIQAEVNAQYGINKNDKKFGNIFSNFANNRYVAVTLSMPLLDWGKGSLDIQSAKINLELQKLKKNNIVSNIQNEILSVINNVNSAKERLLILSKNIEIAEKSYLISLERFKSGAITSSELSQVQLKLTEARLNELNALIDYKTSVAELERKTYLSFN
ncbi:MAG: TolC family protein [Ignavibacteria bacterium]|jgi:outer membrane protein TolC